jgi:hypothetical protein
MAAYYLVPQRISSLHISSELEKFYTRSEHLFPTIWRQENRPPVSKQEYLTHNWKIYGILFNTVKLLDFFQLVEVRNK